MTFADTLKGTKEGSEKIIHIDDPALSDEIGEEFKSQLMDEIELLDGASADLIWSLSQRESFHLYFRLCSHKLWC